MDELANFQNDLAFSHTFEDHPIWDYVYKKTFPTMLGMVSYRQDGFWQREGVDRGIILPTTKQLFVDEKVRGRNKKTGKVYDDVLLEYLSSKENNKPGWVCKPLRADYIAYLIYPRGRCYLLPVVQLQIAWLKYGNQWIKDYPKIEAPNPGYTTVSVGVPPDILFQKIGQELRVCFKPFELEPIEQAA
jgi:hypothetical protein